MTKSACNNKWWLNTVLNLFKVNNKDIKTKSVRWSRSGVFIVNFKQIQHNIREIGYDFICIC